MRYIVANGQGVIYQEEEFEVSEGEGDFLLEVKQWPAGPYVVYIQMEGYKYIQLPFIRIRD